jgi:hypothetical protein
MSATSTKKTRITAAFIIIDPSFSDSSAGLGSPPNETVEKVVYGEPFLSRR